MNKKEYTSKNMIYEIIKELLGRSGFDDWWEQIDNDIQHEIDNNLVKIALDFID